MKTNIFKLAAILIAAIALSTTGCKKDDDDNNDEVNSKSLQQLSKDEVAVENATGEVLKDVNSVLSGGSSKTLYGLPCNVTIDSTNIVGDTITYSITYNGLNCEGTLMRTGNAEVKKNINTHWSDAGAKVYIKFIDLKITKVSDNKFVTINGTKSLENVTGGYLSQLGTIYTVITHRAIGAIQATFDDNTTRTWNFARQFTYSGVSGTYVITGEGLGSAAGYDSLECWGINRDGEAFYSKVISPVVVREECEWHPCSGKIFHDIPSDNKNATVEFGYDDNNLLITNGDCPTRYKVDWVKGTHNGTLYIQLP
jgi:hypothetical protein